MSHGHTESGRSSEQPIENLHKRWARQCDALWTHEKALLALADDLPSYEVLLKDVRLKSSSDDVAASLDQLPEIQQRTIASLNLAIEALKALEAESGLRFNGEVTRFAGIRDQLQGIDCTSIPSSIRFQSEFPNHVFGLTALRDNYSEYRDLQHQSRYMTNGDKAMRALHEAMPEQRGALEDAARNVRIISQLMEVARTEAVKKMKPFVEKLGNEVIQLADSCIEADRLTTARDPDVDVARSVSSLKRYGMNLRKGNLEFFTSTDYRREVGSYLSKAYTEREPYATQLQNEKVKRSAPVTEEQAKAAGGTGDNRWTIFKVLWPKKP